MIMLCKCVEGIENIDANEYVIPSQSSSEDTTKKYTRKGSRKMLKSTASLIER